MDCEQLVKFFLLLEHEALETELRNKTIWSTKDLESYQKISRSSKWKNIIKSRLAIAEKTSKSPEFKYKKNKWTVN